MRSFRVDSETDVSHLKANLSDGVLVISAPKRVKPQPKKIKITTNLPNEHEKLEDKKDTDDNKDDNVERKDDKQIEVETVDPEEC